MLSLMLLELTLQEVVADIPHDAGAMIVYLLLGAFVGLVWYGSRAGPSTNAPPSADGTRESRSVPSAVPAEGAASAPDPAPVAFDPATLSRAPDVRRLHPEVR
jgi:hypothetical protein